MLKPQVLGRKIVLPLVCTFVCRISDELCITAATFRTGFTPFSFILETGAVKRGHTTEYLWT